MRQFRFSRFAVVVFALFVLLVGMTGSVQADPPPDEGILNSDLDVHGHVHDQHGGTAGHLPATSQNVRLVGKMNVNQDFPGRVADVGVLGNYAYLGAFNERDCQKGGVYVFDITNPAAPKQINFIRAANNSYVGEGVQVIHLSTAFFNGDILIQNNEICGPANTGAKGGLSLIDVTDPKVHQYLAEGVGDFNPPSVNGASVAHQIHSAFAWQAGANAYAVLVDDEEPFDVDIMDITNPRNPVLIKEYSLNAQFPQIIQPELGSAASFLHDMVVKKIGAKYVMLLSYWDGGYVLLDVTDPRNAKYLGDTNFTNPDPQVLESLGYQVLPEGNAHQAEFTLDNAYIIAADEDFSPYSVIARNTTDSTTFQATQGSDTPQIDANRALVGRTVFVGRACIGDPAVPAATAAATIAVVERGLCTFTEKVTNVQAAGYAGVIVFNREGADGCTALLNMLVSGNIPALFVNRPTGFGFFNTPYDDAACRDGNVQQAPIVIGTLGDSVSVTAVFDGWGYVHLYRNGSGKLAELDTYVIPEAMNPAYAAGFGDLSVHEVATSAKRRDLAYLSYYAGGLRVLKIVGSGSSAKLQEVGRFIDQGGNNFWGVQVWQQGTKEYVLASDRDYGIYIFEYTGP